MTAIVWQDGWGTDMLCLSLLEPTLKLRSQMCLLVQHSNSDSDLAGAAEVPAGEWSVWVRVRAPSSFVCGGRGLTRQYRYIAGTAGEFPTLQISGGPHAFITRIIAIRPSYMQ